MKSRLGSVKSACIIGVLARLVSSVRVSPARVSLARVSLVVIMGTGCCHGGGRRPDWGKF